MAFCSWGRLTKVVKGLHWANWSRAWHPYSQTQTKGYWNILKRTRNGLIPTRNSSYQSATNSTPYVSMKNILCPFLFAAATMYVPLILSPLSFFPNIN